MKTQLTSMLRWFVSVLYGLLSDPQRVRLALTVVVLCLFVAALLVPTLATLADGLPGGGSTQHP